MEYLYRPIDPRVVVVVVAAMTASAHDNHRNENVFLGNNVATRSKTKRLAGCVYAANGKGAVGGQTMGGRRWQLLFEYSPIIVCVSMVLLVSTRLRCRDCGCRRSDMDDDGEESEVVRFNLESSLFHEGEPSTVASSSRPISNDAIAAEIPPPSKPFR